MVLRGQHQGATSKANSPERGRRDLPKDQLYSCERLLQITTEDLKGKAIDKLHALLEVGYTPGDVLAAWSTKEAEGKFEVTQIKSAEPRWVGKLVGSMTDEAYLLEVQSLDRTIKHRK